jgi:hypothetical protein
LRPNLDISGKDRKHLVGGRMRSPRFSADNREGEKAANTFKVTSGGLNNMFDTSMAASTLDPRQMPSVVSPRAD